MLTTHMATKAKANALKKLRRNPTKTKLQNNTELYYTEFLEFRVKLMLRAKKTRKKRNKSDSKTEKRMQQQRATHLPQTLAKLCSHGRETHEIEAKQGWQRILKRHFGG